MNKFSINKTNLNFTDPLKLIDFDIKIKSIPTNYKLIGFKKVNTIVRDINKKLSEQGCLVVDKNVFNIYFKNKITIDSKRIFIVNAKESNKNIETVLKICSFYSKHNINKGSEIFIVGGGILQDLGGSASYLFKRGIPWTYIPTTLLGISDSCLGGKTAVNFNTYKNLLGLFSAPKEVILSSDFIKTLSPEDISCGYGEIFRLAITGGMKSFNFFKKNIEASLNGSKSALEDLIKYSLMVKKSVIEEDEYEIDIRKSMNYGHTIGHALEAMTNYKIPHGIAVAIGILIENNLAQELKFMDSRLCDEIFEQAKKIIDKKYIKLLAKCSFNNIAEHLSKDKKTIGNKANYTYLKKLGDMQFSYNDITKTKKIISESRNLIVNKLQN